MVGTLGILEASDIGAKAVEQGHEVADLGRGDGIFQFDVRHDPFSLDVAAPSLGRYGHKEKRPGRLMPPGRLGEDSQIGKPSGRTSSLIAITRVVLEESDTPRFDARPRRCRSEEHTSELQSLMRISFACFFL